MIRLFRRGKRFGLPLFVFFFWVVEGVWRFYCYNFVMSKRSSYFSDSDLRPKSWSEYVGQGDVKRNVRILIDAAKERGHMPEHMIFYGPAGLGKTTLANLIAIELGADIKITSGSAIERGGDLASILTNLSDGEVLFIDEIHRLNKNIEEMLYPAMESGVLDVVIGKGPSARVVQLQLANFTLIAATTRLSAISSPMLSRFSGGVYRLKPYSDEEIFRILKRSAGILGFELGDESLMEIANRSRSTPRIANFLLRRVRDYLQIAGDDGDEVELTRKALDLFGFDRLGLGVQDIDYLIVLRDKFGGGPVGVKTLAAALDEEVDTLEAVIEPYLMRIGFIERTSRGRVLLDLGKEYLERRIGDGV